MKVKATLVEFKRTYINTKKHLDQYLHVSIAPFPNNEEKNNIFVILKAKLILHLFNCFTSLFYTNMEAKRNRFKLLFIFFYMNTFDQLLWHTGIPEPIVRFVYF